ncbi:type VI secretion system VgrG family protein [Pseudomonas psychrotolerans]|nr:type VI secretion system VgrG family protein [Pseudomonas psychrotolerans]
MFSPANTPRFTLTLPGLAHDFQVLAFQGWEALNEPYRFEIELISEKSDWDLAQLLHRPAWLGLAPGGSGIHGLLGAIVQGDSGRRLTRYRLELVPRLAYLAQRTNSRIFQNLTVPQILGQLLEEHGILEGAYRLALGPTPYPARDYCVQYGESDLHFLDRLCEEEGIHYHFEHQPEGAVLVFGDDATSFPRLDATAYHPGSGQVADRPVIRRLQVGLQTRSTQLTLRDQDPLQPRLRLESRSDAEQQPTLEHYAFPAGFHDRTRGKQLSSRGLEALRVDSQTAQGQGDQPTLATGHFLPLTEHPRADWNQLWLLTRIEHQGRQPQVLEEGLGTPQLLTLPDDADWTQGYRNLFAMPFPGNCPSGPCRAIPNRGCSANRAPWSPVRLEKKSTAMPLAGSRCNSIGIAKARRMSAPVAGCASPAVGRAIATAPWPCHASAWRYWSAFSKGIPTSR